MASVLTRQQEQGPARTATWLEEGKPCVWSVFWFRLRTSSFYLLSSFIPHSDLVRGVFYPHVTIWRNWGLEKRESVQGDITSEIGSSEFESHWLQSYDNMLLPVFDFPFKECGARFMKRDEKTTQRILLSARFRDTWAQREVQDQNRIPGEDTGDWTLVLRMQPQARLDLPGLQFPVGKGVDEKRLNLAISKAPSSPKVLGLSVLRKASLVLRRHRLHYPAKSLMRCFWAALPGAPQGCRSCRRRA